jgi:flagellar biosynthesis chaperone FliJ
MSEKERIEKELKETLDYYERLIQQYKEAKESTTKDLIELQKQIAVLREKIDNLKKSLEKWIPKKP